MEPSVEHLQGTSSPNLQFKRSYGNEQFGTSRTLVKKQIIPETTAAAIASSLTKSSNNEDNKAIKNFIGVEENELEK